VREVMLGAPRNLATVSLHARARRLRALAQKRGVASAV
jgi:hypothetical protein